MTKEQEIVRSFLLSTFNWVDIDTSGTNGFEAAVCPKGNFWNWSFGFNDEKPLKVWKTPEECKHWLPDSAIHKSLESFNIDKSGKERRYEQYTKKIDDDTIILLEISQGSISGVGYSKGYELRIGIVYKNFIFKLYQFKTCQESGRYECNAYYDHDYISSIDLSDMKPLQTSVDLYMYDSHTNIRTYTPTSYQNMVDVLSLACEDGAITFSSNFLMNFKNHDDMLFSKSVLEDIKPKKIIMEDNFDIEEHFNIPDSLESIELKFKVKDWSEGQMEDFIDENKTLGKYLNCSDDCEKIAAREKLNKERGLADEGVNLWFEYHELSGYVHTNKYQLGLLEDYYKDAKFVTLKIADTEIVMKTKDFWKCITIDKKIKHKSLMEKAHNYFGDKNGYTAWFPEECDTHPQYEFEKEMNND